MRRYALVATLLLVACLSSPTDVGSTSSSLFDFSPGIKALVISGADVIIDSVTSAPSTDCVRSGANSSLLSVATCIDLEPSGTGWIGKSVSAADGDIVVTLQSQGPAIGAHTVSGTISGSAVDVVPAPVGPASLARVVFDSPQTLKASGNTIGLYVAGKIVGASSYVYQNGGTAQCSSVEWSIQTPSVPPFDRR